VLLVPGGGVHQPVRIGSDRGGGSANQLVSLVTRGGGVHQAGLASTFENKRTFMNWKGEGRTRAYNQLLFMNKATKVRIGYRKGTERCVETIVYRMA
jgi:hypothetical protein